VALFAAVDVRGGLTNGFFAPFTGILKPLFALPQLYAKLASRSESSTVLACR
jgi:hypothetical protein